MKLLSKLLLFSLLLLIGNIAQSKENSVKHFKFQINEKSQLDSITKFISIDDYKSGWVEAYANEKEWNKFISWGIPYELIVTSHALKVINMASTVADMAAWDKYPTYEVYAQMMEDFAADYPTICKLEVLGTLASGRKIYAVKISDNVNADDEAEPELFYTGTMHGDETTGYILLLRLIDYILNNYNSASHPEITNLVNNSEIWINPASNPDGTYKGGNSTVSGSQRYNGANIDLNRNFPVPKGSEHPDGEGWAEETVIMMDFAEDHHFALSANFHGGAEVLNYPWDTWSALAVDDDWWQYVSREYVTLAQENSPAGYLTDLNNGITNGYAWYQTYGSRQDYMNYFHNCREITMEVSATKLLSSDQLDDHWDYNKDALLAYLYQGIYGVKGIVTDGSGNPLEAKITVVGHDDDNENSWVFSDVRAGDYIRYLKSGTYSLMFSADNFVDKIVDNVVVVDGEATVLNVVMGPPAPEMYLARNSVQTEVVLDEIKIEEFVIANVGSADFNYNISIENAASNPWISLGNTSSIIEGGKENSIHIILNANGLNEEIYTCNLKISGDTSVTVPVTMTVYTRPLIEVNKAVFDTTLIIVDEHLDSLIISNGGNADLHYTLSIKDAAMNDWIFINKDSGVISPKSASKVYINYKPANVGIGYYSTKILVGGDIPMAIPVSLKVNDVPNFKEIDDVIIFEKLIGETETKSISLKNIGGGILTYKTRIEYEQGNNWVTVDPVEGEIGAAENKTIDFRVNCSNLVKGEFNAKIYFDSEYDTLQLPLFLKVDTLPELQQSKTNASFAVFVGQTVKDTVDLKNIGGGSIDIDATIEYQNGNNWLIPLNSTFQIGSYNDAKFIYTLDARNLEPGIYNASISFGTQFNDTVNITFEAIANPKLGLDIYTLNKIVDYQKTIVDTILLKNEGGGVLSYQIDFDLENDVSWVKANKSSGEIFGGAFDTLLLSFDATLLPSGNYNGKLMVSTTDEKRIPIDFKVRKPAVLNLSNADLIFTLLPNEQKEDEIKIVNNGESALNYELKFDGDVPLWLTVEPLSSGVINAFQSTTIVLKARANDLEDITSHAKLEFSSNVGDSTINITMNVLASLPENDEANDSKIYPNPFLHEATFEFGKLEGEAQLEIFNVIGVKVAELNPLESNAVATKFHWSGTDIFNNAVPEGTYIYKVKNSVKSISGIIQKR